MAIVLQYGQLIGVRVVFLWLSRGELKGETEIAAAQDLALKTNKMQYIYAKQNHSICTLVLCKQLDETEQHNIPAC